MSAATVAITAGRESAFNNLSAIYVTVTATATDYATLTGGLPFDLFDTLAIVSPLYASISTADIRGFIPDGLSSGVFILSGFEVGTVTATEVPCTIRMYGAGENAQDPFVEIDDAAITGTFSGWLIVDRG
jgi:hypothetical protein